MTRSRTALDQQLAGRVRAFLEERDTKPRPKVDNRPGVRFENLDSGAELMLYDEVGFWGVTAADVAEQLQGYRGDLNVRVNSPGGDVFDGYAIYNMLAAHPGRVTVTIEGLAASAASFIAMAGDTVRIGSVAQLMIHDALGMCIGNAADMVDFADMLGRVSDAIATTYAARSGLEADRWRTMMRAETWFSPQEALDLGLVDEVMPPRRRDPQPDPEPRHDPPQGSWDLSVFMHPGRTAARPVDGAVGPHDTPVAEGEWDGAANEKRLPSPVPVATARQVYGYYDSDAVTDGAAPKSACKLPHHFVNGDGTPGAASLAAVRNALARLPQTQGLSDAERATIERHLRSHLAAADTEDHHPPEDRPTSRFDPAQLRNALKEALQ